MILGSYTFALLPGTMTVIKSNKVNASVQTYTDIAYFSWTPSIVGKNLILRWNALTIAQFDSIDALFQADAQIVFDPTSYIGSATYNVEVAGFTGEYWTGDIPNRLNCELRLLIMSVV